MDKNFQEPNKDCNKNMENGIERSGDCNGRGDASTGEHKKNLGKM